MLPAASAGRAPVRQVVASLAPFSSVIFAVPGGRRRRLTPSRLFLAPPRGLAAQVAPAPSRRVCEHPANSRPSPSPAARTPAAAATARRSACARAGDGMLNCTEPPPLAMDLA